MNLVRKIVVYGVELEVEFGYAKGYPATEDEPEAPDEIFIDAVLVDEINIINLCGDGSLGEIEKELWCILNEGVDV